MQTLEDFNKQKLRKFKKLDSILRLNGIQCPNCNKELYDIKPNILLASYPPKKSIVCNNCGYTGYRIA